jgi:hypothetical protein
MTYYFHKGKVKTCFKTEPQCNLKFPKPELCFFPEKTTKIVVLYFLKNVRPAAYLSPKSLNIFKLLDVKGLSILN